MAKRNLKETPGSKLFAPLTCDENQILSYSLMSGMAKQSNVINNHEMHAETAETHHDLHVAWNKRWDAEHPKDGGR